MYYAFHHWAAVPSEPGVPSSPQRPFSNFSQFIRNPSPLPQVPPRISGPPSLPPFLSYTTKAISNPPHCLDVCLSSRPAMLISSLHLFFQVSNFPPFLPSSFPYVKLPGSFSPSIFFFFWMVEGHTCVLPPSPPT